jgi:hypothetical protein
MHHFKRLGDSRVTFENLDHVQAKAAVYQARQDAHFRMAKHFPGEFGCAIGCRQPSEIAALGSAGAVRQNLCRSTEAVEILIVVAADIEQRGFSPPSQGADIHARRDGKENVPQPDRSPVW